VIACNFREFEIWEPGRFPGEARARFALAELPDRYDSLLFLQSETIEPVFAEHRRELTTDAAWAQSSTLETRLRYTPTTVFETFPWPDPATDDQRQAVASAASALDARRSELCLEHQLGLTALYNLMDDGGFTDLAALHKKLDVAVATAYGWPASVAQNPAELVTRLTALNREIVEGGRPYNPFGETLA